MESWYNFNIELPKGEVIFAAGDIYWILPKDLKYSTDAFYFKQLTEKILCITFNDIGEPTCVMADTHIANIHYFITTMVRTSIRFCHQETMKHIFDHLDEYIFEASLLRIAVA